MTIDEEILVLILHPFCVSILDGRCIQFLELSTTVKDSVERTRQCDDNKPQ